MQTTQISPAEAQVRRFREVVLRGEDLEAAVARIPDKQLLALLFDWRGMWARPEQLLPPGDWDTWLLLAGRGFGKTRTGAETVNEWAEAGQPAPIGIIAPTAKDYRETCVEGPAGILACAKPWFRPKFEPSKSRLTWPNGVKGLLLSADEPERSRGVNLAKLWADELAAWTTTEAWDLASMGLRIEGQGQKPQAIITTTPKPIPLIVDLLKDAGTHVTRGSTLANSRNLSAKYIRRMLSIYGGTRLGRQELYAEVLQDSGMLFNVEHFRESRVDTAPTLERIVVAVDPAQTSNEGSDYTGIWVMGVDAKEHLYALEDATCKGSPQVWGNAVIKAFRRWQADMVVGEVNVGGEMVGSLLRTIDPNLPFREVRAGRGAGKGKRAEPVAALVEQKRVHLVGPMERWEKFLAQAHVFSGLNGKRDDRVDAMLWAAHELVLAHEPLQLI